MPSALGYVVSAQHAADLSRLLAVSWVVLAVTTLVSALLGWIAAGRVLRPVRTITQTAQTISAGNLHERLALAGPNDEFKALGDTLDELLAAWRRRSRASGALPRTRHTSCAHR